MKSNFDSDVSLENNVLEGEDAGSQKHETDQSSPEGSRESQQSGSSSSHSSPSHKMKAERIDSE